ncbi:hypothetical protein RISK_001421 [Rhodopirellula islandica]|uniref:Uncharacterized protein n=1 Tax=Rhodopirellula islandica TaxID=595434 RepID=A0A0J1BJC6_RHOIS|nr:hypothetical protein RISK_001421 [Rhodopirellula islandica]
MLGRKGEPDAIHSAANRLKGGLLAPWLFLRRQLDFLSLCSLYHGWGGVFLA